MSDTGPTEPSTNAPISLLTYRGRKPTRQSPSIRQLIEDEIERLIAILDAIDVLDDREDACEDEGAAFDDEGVV